MNAITTPTQANKFDLRVTDPIFEHSCRLVEVALSANPGVMIDLCSARPGRHLLGLVRGLITWEGRRSTSPEFIAA